MAFTREFIRNAAKESDMELPKEFEDALVQEHLSARDAYAAGQVKTALEENKQEFLIFAIQDGGMTDPRLLKAKLYSFKVYEGGRKLLDFVPSKEEDGEVGLYDTVNGGFYRNVGEGEFIAGPEAGDSGESGDASVVYTAGDGTGRMIEKDCPWGTQEMADSILAVMKDAVYIPFSAQDAILDPAAEIGDGIDVGGIYSILAQSSIEFDKMCLADISAPSSDDLDDEYPYLSAEKRRRRALEDKVDDLEKKIEDLNERIEDAQDQLGDIEAGTAGVITFNGRDGEVLPEEEDYQEFIDAAIREAIYESWGAKY